MFLNEICHTGLQKSQIVTLIFIPAFIAGALCSTIFHLMTFMKAQNLLSIVDFSYFQEMLSANTGTNVPDEFSVFIHVQDLLVFSLLWAVVEMWSKNAKFTNLEQVITYLWNLSIGLKIKNTKIWGEWSLTYSTLIIKYKKIHRTVPVWIFIPRFIDSHMSLTTPFILHCYLKICCSWYFELYHLCVYPTPWATMAE